MVNFLFLVDTSYVMDTKVGEYGLTLLELCKTAIHRSVNNRRKSISKPTDSNNNNTKFNHKYLLVTHSSSSSVKCGWDNATDYFLKAIEALQASDAPNFGTALSTAFRLLQSNPNQILSYGQGLKSWQNEMNVIMILTYCIDSCSYSSKSLPNKRNEILKLSARTLYGEELQSDYIQWNTRIFVGNINVFGTLQIDTQTNSVRDALNNLCIETSPTDAVHVVNNELHSLGQIERWVSAIMRDNGRDGVMVEFWDSSKEEKASEDDTHAIIGKFNNGELFREFIIPNHCDAKWPIPEHYSPKEHHHELPARRCRPQIAISRAQKGAACLPRSEWLVPYEQYEITSQRMRDFLNNLPHTMCYYAYMQYSAGAKFNYAKPWGTLKGDPKRNKAFLYVFVYDFPFVWNQISVFLQAKKRNFHNFSADEWKRAVGAYLNFIPSYYVQSVKDLFMQTTKGIHLPSFPATSSLEPSLVSYINEVQRKWRGNADYKVNNRKKGEQVADNDVVMINARDLEENEIVNECDELHGFPFEEEDHEDDDCEESDVLLDAITKQHHKHKQVKQEKNKEFKEWMDLELPFMVNTRKRNWSQHNQQNVYHQTRKRRKLFYQKHMETKNAHNKNKDEELLAYVANNEIGSLMNDLSLSIFGDEHHVNDIKQDMKQRKDSFDVSLDAQRTRTLDMEAQHKLISNFANIAHNNNESFARNKVSVYGHNNANSWKNRYKLILDQKEDDQQHIEKHNNMGNYTMYAERLRIFKKEEFRNPFQIESEYSNYALSLSFIFLQQKIHEKHINSDKTNKNDTTQNRGKSFLETETKLKSDKLLSIKEVLAIKKRTNEAMWTKNELSTRFYEEEEEDRDPNPRNKHALEYQHSLLKSADWLSCQVLHSLKPTNLGGNPFKKRRRKSPFPTVIKPRNVKQNNNNKNSINAVQSKFEQQAANSLPHISGSMTNNEEKESVHVEEKALISTKTERETLLSQPPPPKLSPPPAIKPKPKLIMKLKPKPKKSVLDISSTNTNKPKINKSKIVNKQIKKPVNILIKKLPKIKPKIDINKAIESAKRKQRILQRKTQILPMKRRSNSSHTSSHSNSSSPSISPTAINMEPATKKQKLSNGVNGSNIKRGNEHNKNHHNNNGLNHKHYNHHNHKQSKLEKKQHKKNAKMIQIVNTNNNNNNYLNHKHTNGHTVFHKQQSTESQAMNIMSFMATYREMVRSPNTFDTVWFENGLSCLNGLDIDAKHSFCQMLMNEAITYNRYQLAQNIHNLCKKIENK